MLLLPPGLEAPAPQPPEAVVRGFYGAVIAQRGGGIPGGEDLARLRPFLGRRLRTLVLRASEAETIYDGKQTEPVPPLVEGCLWTSLFEGITRLEAVVPEPGGTASRRSCLATLAYVEGETSTWRDRVRLVREGGRWVVDDVQLLGDWDFCVKGRVSERLRNVIRTAREAPQP